MIEKQLSLQAEISVHYLHYPLLSVITSCWGLQPTSLTRACESAIQASYEYYADFAPQPGDPKGAESIDLFANEAMLMHWLTGILALHYQRTGETPDFESPYIPSWLIKGEFPSREEVLFENPPEFSLQGIGLA